VSTSAKFFAKSFDHMFSIKIIDLTLVDFAFCRCWVDLLLCLNLCTDYRLPIPTLLEISHNCSPVICRLFNLTQVNMFVCLFWKNLFYFTCGFYFRRKNLIPYFKTLAFVYMFSKFVYWFLVVGIQCSYLWKWASWGVIFSSPYGLKYTGYSKLAVWNNTYSSPSIFY
jgi:hypothetical protein